MTMIAGFRWGDQWALFGDMLITSKAPGIGATETMTRSDLHHIMDGADAGKVVGATQKLFIPHPRVIVAWAGAVYQAKGFCTALDKVVRGRRNPTRDVSTFVDEFDNSLIVDADIVVLWICNDGSMGSFFNGTSSFQLGCLEDIFVSGSGQSEAFHAIDMIAENMPADLTPSLDRIIAFSLGACAKFQCLQALGGWGLAEGWGGAFEIAVRDGMRFKKVNHIGIHCWTWRDDNGFRETANEVIKFWHGYDQGFGAIKDKYGTLYLISPIVRPATKKLLKFEDKKVKWSVIGQAYKKDNTVEFSVGVRHVVQEWPDWNYDDNTFTVTSTIVDEIRAKTFIFWNS